MVKSNSKLANIFEKEFLDAIRAKSRKNLERAWQSCESRTAFYTTEVIPQIAHKMDLDIINELFRIDFLLGKTIDNVQIPFIAIESENLTAKTYEKMQKLIILSCPLKVLITCCEWSKHCTRYSSERNANTIALWEKYLKAARTEDALDGVFSFYIAEWADDNFLRYFGYRSEKESIREIGELLKINMNENKGNNKMQYKLIQ